MGIPRDPCPRIPVNSSISMTSKVCSQAILSEPTDNDNEWIPQDRPPQVLRVILGKIDGVIKPASTRTLVEGHHLVAKSPQCSWPWGAAILWRVWVTETRRTGVDRRPICHEHCLSLFALHPGWFLLFLPAAHVWSEPSPLVHYFFLILLTELRHSTAFALIYMVYCLGESPEIFYINLQHPESKKKRQNWSSVNDCRPANERLLTFLLCLLECGLMSRWLFLQIISARNHWAPRASASVCMWAVQTAASSQSTGVNISVSKLCAYPRAGPASFSPSFTCT